MEQLKSVKLTATLLAVVLIWGGMGGSVADAQDSSRLAVTIRDGETGAKTPVRVKLTDERGKHTRLPGEAIKIMYGRQDIAERYGFQPDSAFYVDGAFSLDLVPGEYELTVTKGNEYLSQNIVLDLGRGDLDTTITMKRWINMPERGWYSSDDHIHVRRSPRENPLLLRWVAAEDIHVGHLLQMGDYHATYYSQYAFGEKGRYHEHGEKGHAHTLLSSGQEDPRTHEIGHTISLGADRFVRNSDKYYYYDLLADEIHEVGGLFGYAHQGVTFHGYRGLTLDVFAGNVDFMEILQSCIENGPLETEHYYHFLDMGFKITAAAGSDFPWCGFSRYSDEPASESGSPWPRWDAQIGNVRFYTYVGDDYSFDNWKKAFDSGHTFVSNGPIVDLKINNQLPGSVIKVKKGEEITISATAYGHKQQVPLESLELIGHGDLLDSVDWQHSSGSRAKLTLNKKIKAREGIWIAAKAKAGPLQFAHTSPVYIYVDGQGFHDRDELNENLDKAEAYLDEIKEVLETQDRTIARNEAWRYGKRLDERINNTLEKIEKLRRLAQ